MFPRLETPRLLLTEIHLTDAPDVLELFSSARVVQYYDIAAFTHLPEAQNLIQRIRDRYDSKLGIRWAIRLRSSGKLIGTCGFNSWTPAMRNAVLGYDLNEAFWGSGFAPEAASEIIRFGFAGALACGELHRIQADTVPGNARSERMLVRMGFKEEGLRRECGYWKGTYHDLKCYGLLKQESAAARLATE